MTHYSIQQVKQPMKLSHVMGLVVAMGLFLSFYASEVDEDREQSYVLSGDTIYSKYDYKCVAEVMYFVTDNHATPLKDQNDQKLQCQNIKLTQAQAVKYKRA